MKDEILKSISKKRSVNGVELFLKRQGFTIIPPSGGNYKVWYDRSNLITVKIIDLSPEESIEEYENDEYDVLIGRQTFADRTTVSISVNYEQ